MAGVWGGMPTIRIVIIASAEHGRAYIQKIKNKKKTTYPLDKKNERNMEWFPGLKPRTTWTGMRGCGHILSAQDLSARLCGASETWGLSYMKFPWHPYLYLQKKKNAQRGLLSGSRAKYGPAGGDRLLLPPTVPLKSKGSWEWPMGSIAQLLPTAMRQL